MSGCNVQRMSIAPATREAVSANHTAMLQVGDFKHLIETLEADPSLVRKLRDILKILDEGRWSELRQTVESSVLVDNRVRAFMCPAPDGVLLLLFQCHQGRIDFASPLGLYSPQRPGSAQYVYAATSSRK